MPQTSRFSPSIEDYLKAIFALTEHDDTATTSDIASTLSVQPASVSGMVKRLADLGVVEHEPYRGVSLTPSGRREALRIVRRHRIIETYLSVRLGYSWEDVHDEAERLEHAASDQLIERMADALKNPRHDPHGAPIPTPGGEIDSTSYPTLADSDATGPIRIRAVRDDEPERLRYLEARGLLPGVILAVEERAPFNGPVTVRLGGPDGDTQAIGFDLARCIFIDQEPAGQSADESARSL